MEGIVVKYCDGNGCTYDKKSCPKYKNYLSNPVEAIAFISKNSSERYCKGWDPYPPRPEPSCK